MFDWPVLEVGQVFNDVTFDQFLLRHEGRRLDEGHLSRGRNVEDRVARRIDQGRADRTLER